MGFPCTAPSATHREIALLRHDALVVGCQEVKCHRTIPSHVPVALLSLSIARTAVRTFLEHTNLFRIDVVYIRYNRHNGEWIFSIIIYICTRNYGRRKESILVETEAETLVPVYGKDTRFRSLCIRIGWGREVAVFISVPQSGSFGNVDAHLQRTLIELSGLVHFRSWEHQFCKSSLCLV